MNIRKAALAGVAVSGLILTAAPAFGATAEAPTPLSVSKDSNIKATQDVTISAAANATLAVTPGFPLPAKPIIIAQCNPDYGLLATGQAATDLCNFATAQGLNALLSPNPATWTYAAPDGSVSARTFTVTKGAMDPGPLGTAIPNATCGPKGGTLKNGTNPADPTLKGINYCSIIIVDASTATSATPQLISKRIYFNTAAVTVAPLGGGSVTVTGKQYGSGKTGSGFGEPVVVKDKNGVTVGTGQSNSSGNVTINFNVTTTNNKPQKFTVEGTITKASAPITVKFA